MVSPGHDQSSARVDALLCVCVLFGRWCCPAQGAAVIYGVTPLCRQVCGELYYTAAGIHLLHSSSTQQVLHSIAFTVDCRSPLLVCHPVCKSLFRCLRDVVLDDGQQAMPALLPRNCLAAHAIYGNEGTLHVALVGMQQDLPCIMQVPDDIVFVEEIPHNATGKVSKLTLRQMFKDYKPATRAKL